MNSYRGRCSAYLKRNLPWESAYIPQQLSRTYSFTEHDDTVKFYFGMLHHAELVLGVGLVQISEHNGITNKAKQGEATCGPPIRCGNILHKDYGTRRTIE